LDTVLHKGVPDKEVFSQLDDLAKAVAEAHKSDPNVETA
jgi:hypothetical protein